MPFAIIIVMEITLKNIYRVLTQRDFPVYSSGILPERSRHGLTILKFYQELLLDEWCMGRTGRLIFKAGEERSRFSSELFSRRKEFPYYQSFLQEIMYQMSQEQFLRQVEAFRDFLVGKEYQQAAFRIKFPVFIRMCAEEDPWFTKEIMDFLSQFQKPVLPQDFLDSWLLTMLVLHALAGPEMSGANLSPVRSEDYSPETLYRLWKSKGTEREYGAVGQNTLQAEPLSPLHFFGREAELFELSESVRKNEKILLTGIGGSGKTELLRQLRRELIRTPASGEVLDIPYEQGLAESFAGAFPGFLGETAVRKFYEFLYYLNSSDTRKQVIFIDNAEFREEEADLWKELSRVKSAVIVCSRNRRVPNFKTVFLKPLPLDAAVLVVRSCYLHAISDKEKRLLTDRLKSEELRNPLMLRALGRAAASNGWTVEELLGAIDQGPGKIRWSEAEAEHQLGAMLRALFNEDTLSAQEKKTVRLLSLLPFRSYFPEQLSEYLGNGRSASSKTAEISKLYQKGWLERQGDSYSLYPMIAEGIRKKGLREKDFPQLWDALSMHIPSVDLENMNEFAPPDPVSLNSAKVLVHAAKNLQGPISEDLFSRILSGAWLIVLSFDGGSALCRSVEEFKQQLSEISWEQEALIQVMNCRMESFDPEKIRACIEKGFQTEKPEQLHRFCVNVLPYLAEMDAWQSYAEELVLRLMDDPDDPELQMLLAYIRLSRSLNAGNAEETVEELAKMRRTFDNTEEDVHRYGYYARKRLLHIAWTNTVFLLFALKTLPEEAEHLYQAYPDMDFDTGSVDQEVLRLRMLAARADYRGESQEAVRCIREVTEILARYTGSESRTFLISQSDLAFYLNKTGEAEEAVKIYEKLLQDTEAVPMNPDYVPLLLLNAGATYFSLQKYDRAEEKFTAALESAKNAGVEMAEAAASYWLSKICRLSGDSSAELDWLTKARSWYQEAFPTEYERNREIAERLEEIRREKRECLGK